MGAGGFSTAYECMSKLDPKRPNVAVKITVRAKLQRDDEASIRRVTGAAGRVSCRGDLQQVELHISATMDDDALPLIAFMKAVLPK